MGILFEKLLAQLLFWLYDFIDTIGAIFNILTGTQTADESRSLLEIFVDSAISTKVILGLCLISVVIAGACVGVRVVKNVIKFKAGGEPSSHATTVKQGLMGIGASVVCIFFVFMFISFSTGLLNMINGVIAPEDNLTLSQTLFDLSVQSSYVVDESIWEEREVGDYVDESGHRVQDKDPSSADGLAWLKDGDQEDNMLDGGYTVDEDGYLRDKDGQKIPVWVQEIERYHPYKIDAEGNLVVENGWCNGFSAGDLKWSMSPDEVFGVHNKGFMGLFEEESKGYSRQPMVRLNAFNLFTAYLVAVIMLISMFMLSVGLVKRIYDIIVLIICMPLVCGTIPLDDGARFRAWRETFMSKVLIAFGAVIALNVFFMLGRFVMSPAFDLTYLLNQGILNSAAVTIFRMLLLLGGAMCINSSQSLIARILGTSADEGREAMQSFAMITSGVRMAAVGALGVGRVAGGIGRGLVGGTNRYGRQRTGLLNYAARGVNAVGEHAGGERYSASRGAAFVRALGRMGGRMSNGAGGVSTNPGSSGNKASGLTAPKPISGPNGAGGGATPRQPQDSTFRGAVPGGASPAVQTANAGGGSAPRQQQNSAFRGDTRKGTAAPSSASGAKTNPGLSGGKASGLPAPQPISGLNGTGGGSAPRQPQDSAFRGDTRKGTAAPSSASGAKTNPGLSGGKASGLPAPQPISGLNGAGGGSMPVVKVTNVTQSGEKAADNDDTAHRIVSEGNKGSTLKNTAFKNSTRKRK